MLQKLTFLLKFTLGISFLCLFTYSIVKLAQRRVGNKSYIGAKYLGFFSSRSLKTREKCISFADSPFC